MSLFEFTFGLSAVILGLALAHMASTVSKLAMAGRRVKWAPEPLLLAAIVALVIVSVWLFQWDARNRTETTVGLMVMQVVNRGASTRRSAIGRDCSVCCSPPSPILASLSRRERA